MVTKITTSVISNDAITTDKISGSVSLGVKIANVSIANSTYAVLDDTAVNVGGGYLVITGSGFASGAQVIIDTTTATSTTFVNTTTLRAEVPAKSAATYNLYVVNPDGGTAIKVNGLTYSGFPTWVTSSTLANVVSNTAFTGSLSATGATSYANTTALPAGFNLVTANGYYYGNISVGSATTYSFTVSATDAENQNSDRTFSLTASVVLLAPTSVEYLVVAGGGGGGSNRGGGGGAGGVLLGNVNISTSTAYIITVGAGGTYGQNGTNSTAFSLTSIGGGYGGTHTDPSGGGTGGSGGGAAMNYNVSSFSGGSGTAGPPRQGYNGGNSSGTNDNIRSTGGGGGYGSAGVSTPSSRPDGGAGLEWPTGSGIYYAGGGGGSTGLESGSSRSSDGGGYGGSSVGGDGTMTDARTVAGTPGLTNTGGGGGGSGANLNGGTGGSGVVIIRYPDTYSAAASTTGSPTLTVAGGYRVYKFTGSGSITF